VQLLSKLTLQNHESCSDIHAAEEVYNKLHCFKAMNFAMHKGNELLYVQVILFKELLVSSNALVFIRLCLLCLLWLLQFFRVHILVEVEQSISPLARSSCCKGIHNEMWDPPFDVVLEQNGHSSGVGILGIGSNNGAG